MLPRNLRIQYYLFTVYTVCAIPFNSLRHLPKLVALSLGFQDLALLPLHLVVVAAVVVHAQVEWGFGAGLWVVGRVRWVGCLVEGGAVVVVVVVDVVVVGGGALQTQETEYPSSRLYMNVSPTTRHRPG